MSLNPLISINQMRTNRTRRCLQLPSTEIARTRDAHRSMLRIEKGFWRENENSWIHYEWQIFGQFVKRSASCENLLYTLDNIQHWQSTCLWLNICMIKWWGKFEREIIVKTIYQFDVLSVKQDIKLVHCGRICSFL